MRLQDIRDHRLFLPVSLIFGGVIAVLVVVPFLINVTSPLTGIELMILAVPSMEPAIERGDLLLVRSTPIESIDEGDIAVYDTPYMEQPIVHQVIHKTNDTIETKGDNNDHQIQACETPGGGHELQSQCPDRESINVEQGITDEQVRGIVHSTVPTIGQFPLWAQCRIDPQPLICPHLVTPAPA